MYLLDTNALLFFLYDSEKLSKKASEVIYCNDEKISVSIVSMWEIAIKSSIGKLEIKSSISKIAETQLSLFNLFKKGSSAFMIKIDFLLCCHFYKL